MIKRNIKSISINAIAIIISLVYLFPALWLLLSSFKPANELFMSTFEFFPSSFTLENYKHAFESMQFLHYIFNTIFVTVVATVITIAICSMAGYSLAKYKYRFLDILFILFLSMQMLPTEVIMKPSFEVINKLGMYDSLWGIIWPTVNSMTGIFIMRQFFMTVPNSIAESARIDGASEFKIFNKLMLPLAKAPIAILTIFSIQWRWNDYIWPLIVISDPNKYTLQLALSNLMGEYYIDWSLVIPASIITMLPTLIIFIVFQKQIMKGLAGTGSKEG